MAKRERRMARLLSLAVALALLFPAVFIALEAHHDCIQEGCHICLEIRACANLLREMGMGHMVMAAFGFGFIALALASRNIVAAGSKATLVSLKVKLSN